MENNSSGHIKADTFYNKLTEKNKSDDAYRPGTPVCLKLTGEKLLVLSELEPDPDELLLGAKYLTRTVDHKKKVVFDCEIRSLGDNDSSRATITR